MKKIAQIIGGWSLNIGNAFFQLGGLYALEEALNDAKIDFIGEMPGYPSYWNRKGENPENYYDLSNNINIEYLVLMGPIFRPELNDIWSKSLEKLVDKGTKLILLGIGMMNYERENILKYRSFLTKYKPYILTSRDRETFSLLGDLAENAYDGIDFGFFVSDFYNPIGLYGNKRNRITLNFDKMPEPKIIISSSPLLKNKYDFEFVYNDNWWGGKFSKYRRRLAEYNRYTMFLEGLLPGNKIDRLREYEVLRTDHRPHPLLKKKTYRYPNTLVNDVPYAYLELYKSSCLTLSNRVHACVAALAYGNDAMLFSKSPRSRLMDRLNLNEIKLKPVSLSKNVLKDEKENLIAFLKDCLSEKI